MAAEQKPCMLCSMEVPADEAEEIAFDMKCDENTCVGCGRTFEEARKTEGLL